MSKLRICILVFCIAISLPLAYVIWRTYEGLGREELSQLRFFTETLFDNMEEELADLVRREEIRAVDEYHFTVAEPGHDIDSGRQQPSPLSILPPQAYILGYIQNNPDGSFQTPLAKDPGEVPPQHRDRIDQLRQINETFNRKKLTIDETAAPSPAEKEQTVPEMPEESSFAQRYLSPPERKTTKGFLGQAKARKEEITAGQAMSLAKKDHSLLGLSAGVPDTAEAEQDRAAADGNDTDELGQKRSQADSGEPLLRELAMNAVASRFQVEVAPLQSVFIDDARIFIFRRVAIRNQIYRQGFILLVEPFLRHLLDAHYNRQPVAAYTRLNLFVKNRGFGTEGGQGERNSNHGVLVSSRAFPAPFGFLMAEMMAEAVPASAARRSLNMAFGALGGIMIFGLWAIHRSARTVSEMAERRSQFVSSVTHELKTPLTNIRMYIEMLDQGIATTPEREQEYLRVLASESVRLSRLINHVLELSKLEKKQRRFNLQKGRLEDVLAEVSSLMAQKLAQEGFELEIRAQHIPAVTFDYEVMIQVLINLLENSVKFGRHEPEKKILISASPSKGWVHLAVSDTGPGIPRGSLKKVFDDFYRADHDMGRVTAGTGIGLALVKKFITAMGGRVQAANNPVAGCTITLSLPTDAKP